MRIVAHLISVLLLVPGIVVAAAILAIGHVTSQPDFAKLVGALLDVMLAFLPLAFLAVVLWFVIAVLGFSRRWQRGAAISVAAIAFGTSAVITWPVAGGALAHNWGLLVPAACALVIAIWLASTEWPEPPRTGMQQLQPPRAPRIEAP